MAYPKIIEHTGGDCLILKSELLATKVIQIQTENPDILIVGSGLTGSIMAYELNRLRYSVLVIESRNWVGGNIREAFHESRIRYGVYGPHFFRTGSKRIWDFVNSITPFREHHHILKVSLNNQLYNWPLSRAEMDCYEINVQPKYTIPQTFEEACLNDIPIMVYQDFVENYTQKQWGVHPSLLSPDLYKRIRISDGKDFRLSLKRYQGLPVKGFNTLVEGLLSGIPVMLNTSFKSLHSSLNPRLLTIYTGPIDEYFDFRLGHLGYRGQHRRHTFHDTPGFEQTYSVLNTPSTNVSSIRTIEWKHLQPEANSIQGSLITKETPTTPESSDHYEYPFPDQANKDLCRDYQKLALKEKNVIFAGRLGEYRYLDMDQAVGRALVKVKNLVRALG